MQEESRHSEERRGGECRIDDEERERSERHSTVPESLARVVITSSLSVASSVPVAVGVIPLPDFSKRVSASRAGAR